MDLRLFLPYMIFFVEIIDIWFNFCILRFNIISLYICLVSLEIIFNIFLKFWIIWHKFVLFYNFLEISIGNSIHDFPPPGKEFIHTSNRLFRGLYGLHLYQTMYQLITTLEKDRKISKTKKRSNKIWIGWSYRLDLIPIKWLCIGIHRFLFYVVDYVFCDDNIVHIEINHLYVIETVKVDLNNKTYNLE